MTWRKPVIYSFLYATGSRIPKILNELKKSENASSEQVEALARRKLEGILIHSYGNVPYYQKVLHESKVVVNGQVRLENFSKIPILTKDIIRKEGKNLFSKGYEKRKPFEYTSGGSTGEPIIVLRDRFFWEWNIAHEIYFQELHGLQIGQPQIGLWGSKVDILKARENLSQRLKFWLYNRTLLNSFRMSDEIMNRYIAIWNRIKPKLVWAYTGSILEFGRYLKKTGLTVLSPHSIVCCAEMLTEQVRSFLKDTFRCAVVNNYGSREVGSVAWECPVCDGLHLCVLHNKVEILDENLRSCGSGRMGDIYVTTLNNYSMPLIRYHIGDTAVVSEKAYCSCGGGWPIIESLTGRHCGHFKTKSGEIIHGGYFIVLFWGSKGIKKFQVIQEDYDEIKILIVPEGKVTREQIQDIESKIKVVMGGDCSVSFKFVDEINKSPSGKYIHTFSKVQ